MVNLVKIENIEEMRRQEGIQDVQLRKEIRQLAIGDLVKLTLLADEKLLAWETLLVRITHIRARAFQGELASRPTCPGLAKLPVGFALAFTADHIHSLPKGQPAHEQ